MSGRSERQRHVLGMAVTVQSVALCLATIAVSALVLLSALSWLERMA